MRNSGKLRSDKTLKGGGTLGGGGQLIPLKSLGSRKRLRARSEKMQKKYEEERIPFVKDFLERHPWCVFKMWVHGISFDDSPHVWASGRHVTSCGKRAVDVHEILPRSRGGNIVPIEGQVELDQFLPLCRLHHEFITTHSFFAKLKGYSR